MKHVLNISPAIEALKARPSEFEWRHGSLRHIPSDHRFQFDPNGSVVLHADCACAMLSISEEQGRELKAVAETWTRDHWRPAAINRHFADHFRRPSLWQKIVAYFTGRDHHDDLDLGMKLPEDSRVVPIERAHEPEDLRSAA